MGNILSFPSPFLPAKKVRIVMIGLDNAGKTTLLNHLRLCPLEKTLPTVGFNVKTVQYKSIRFDMWDIGGENALLPLWEHYYDDADALIFVIDSQDRQRITEVRDILRRLLDDKKSVKIPLLIYCNKQDVMGSLGVRDILRQISLRSFVGYRHWFAQGCCGHTGEGIYEGLEWLAARFEFHE